MQQASSAKVPLLEQFHCIFIFNRYEELLLELDWQQERTGQRFTLGDVTDCGKHLISCMTIGNVLTQTLTPKGKRDEFLAMRSDGYKVHFMQPGTGYKIVLLTDPSWSASRGQQVLQHVYGTLFVDFVAKDPNFEHREGQPQIDSAPFLKALRELPERWQ